MVKKLLTALVQDDEITMQKIFQNIRRLFYVKVLSYLQAWSKHNDNLYELSCLLSDKVSTENILTM
jgi:hypothetical protein